MSRVSISASAVFAIAIVIGTAGPAKAEQPLTMPIDALVTDEFVADVRQWATAPVILGALSGRAERVGTLPQDEIDALDKQWRAERESDDQPLITSVLSGPVSSYLTRIQANSVGVLTEIFVMDSNGLNVGQSGITSDYWQGDEGKFQKTYGAGAGAFFIDEAEFHDGTRTWRAQLNMTLDDLGGKPAGAITVEVNLTELERRAAAGLGS